MRITNPVLRKKHLAGTAAVLSLFFVMASGSAQAAAATINCTNPTTGNTVQATITFDKDSYNNGDAMNVSAHYTEGEWALCIYPPDGKFALVTTTQSSAVDKNTGLSTVDANTYGNGSWRAVIAFNRACNSNYRDGSNFCSTSANVSGGTDNGDNGGNDGNDDNGGNDGNSDDPTVAGINIKNPIGTDNFTTLVQNVLKWVLSVVGGVALLMLIYGGMLYVSSAGDQKQAEQGKKVVTWTIMGLVVILLSYSIIRVVNQIFTK